ncbi:MAG: hypothetical protein FWD29_01140 [Micrococcales bacterium]|nr:hypothetical protein [Micrococcales bacterium]
MRQLVHHQPSRRAEARRWGRSVLAAMLALALACLLGGSARAWWTNQASHEIVITGGSFNLTLGELSWTSPTAGLQGADQESLAQFVASPGDMLVITQAFTGTFSGSNLAVWIELDWSELPDAVGSTWHLESASGVEVAPASGEATMGQALTVADLVNPEPTEWRVVVTVTFPEGDPLYLDPTKPGGLTLATSFGQLKLAAHQTREGQGFIDGH